MNPSRSPEVTRLCELSRRMYANPYETIEWPEALDPDQWYMSPELISLYGTEAYNAMDEAQKKRLSFLECVNFFSLNIHGEKALIEGLARHLYQTGPVDSGYLHHFLDEENKHMIYFGEFCMRYAGKLYPDRKMVFQREYLPGEESLLFFAKVLIFEEIVDLYNIRMARDPRLPAVVRQINAMHHRDEARHLVFGRRTVRALQEKFAPTWPVEARLEIQRYLANYFTATWREYYNPDVYREAGLADVMAARQAALTSTHGRSHRRAFSTPCMQYLMKADVLKEEPAL